MELHWLLDMVPYAFDHRGKREVTGDLLKNEDEFVAPRSCDEIAGPQFPREPCAHSTEHLIARGMAHRVVDGLKAIQVEEGHSELALFLERPRNGPLRALREDPSVHKPGERIVVSLALEATDVFRVCGLVAKDSDRISGCVCASVAHR